MGFFRRKASGDHDDERCPRCRERLPEGALECMMCGVTLKPAQGTPSNEEAKASVAHRGGG
jgi:rubredoxin